MDAQAAVTQVEVLERDLGADAYEANILDSLLYPKWPGQFTNYPAFLSLILSVGHLRDEFKQDANHLLTARLQKGPGSPQIVNQLLNLPREGTEKTRSIHYVDPTKDVLPNRNNGWIFIDSKDLFEVRGEEKSVFLVTNIDTGWWQGGFRFGGVDLIRMVQKWAARGSKRKEKD